MFERPLIFRILAANLICLAEIFILLSLLVGGITKLLIAACIIKVFAQFVIIVTIRKELGDK